MKNPTPPTNLNSAIKPWVDYFLSADWHDLVKGISPKITGCGPVYELGDPLGRKTEDIAIADMRELKIAEAHYHPAPEIEIYVGLKGTGIIISGTKEIPIVVGSVVVTPSDTTHFAVPGQGLIIGVINIPRFRPEGYVPITGTSSKYKFDEAQYKRLATK
jgi:hypothetical protein